MGEGEGAFSIECQVMSTCERDPDGIRVRMQSSAKICLICMKLV